MAQRIDQDSTLETFGALPPLPTRTRLPGGEILEELPDARGWIAWQAVRSAQVWAATAPADRGELFGEEIERQWVAHLICDAVPQAVEKAALELAALFAKPRTVEPLLVSYALRSLALWAESEGAFGSALLLADTAARAAPGDGQAAYQAGRGARRAGDGALAEAWFRYGLTLARRQQDSASRAQNLTGLGNLYLGRGRLPLAERMHLRALRAARRARIRAQEGMALHDLAVVATEREDLARAELWAREAYVVYGEGHPRLHALAQDMAYIWMLRGDFRAALAVFRAVLPHFSDVGDRLWVTAHVARAAGGACDRDAFEAAWAEVVPLLRESGVESSLGSALAGAALELAHGALAIGDQLRAAWIAEWALGAARRYGHGKWTLTAESVLEAARSAPESAAPAPTIEEQEAEDRARVATELVNSLDALAGTR